MRTLAPTSPPKAKTYIGIDNGVSGTFAVLDCFGGLITHQAMPTKSELSYTKEKKNINRIDVPGLRFLLDHYTSGGPRLVVIERPMVNPGRFTASLSAVRALEAVLIVLEELELPHQYIDSREWQKALLPSGLKGPDLKVGATDVARRLFPAHFGSPPGLRKIKTVDADSLLIAEYARRKGL